MSQRNARASAKKKKPGAKHPRRPRVPARRSAAVKVTALVLDDEVDGKVRLNRFLSAAGVCSRRAADGLIGRGRITVNGAVVTELGTRVDPQADDVRYDGSRVRPQRAVYILFNKPAGVLCTNAPGEERERVIDFLPKVHGRVYTVGRLDADSEGLILVTNDGDFAQAIAHPSSGVAKTYAVLVRGRVGKEVAEKAGGGVWLAEGKTSGARIVIERTGRDRTYLKVSLREGKNREIRRIFAKLGHPVLKLKRVRIGPLSLHGLGVGRYRFLSRDEVSDLQRLARKGSGR